MTEISDFVSKHRKEIKIPWHKKPIIREDFISKKASDGNYYVKHTEWADEIWIGPYDSLHDAREIIKAYVNGETNNCTIHSVYVENIKEFFKKH